MRSASSFNGQRIRASTFRSIGPVQDSSHRLALVPNELPLPSLLQCMSPLLAQSGHPDTLDPCPLLGVKRTLILHSAMSAFDPKRTLPTRRSPQSKKLRGSLFQKAA